MMNKSIKKIALVGFGNVFNALLGFAFLSAVAKTLDLDSFGKYALLTTLLVALSKLIDFGTNSVFVAKSISTEEKSLLDTFYTLKLLLLSASIPLSIFILIILGLSSNIIIFTFIAGLFGYAVNYTLNTFFQKNEMFLRLVSLNTLPALIKGEFSYLILSGQIVLNLDQSFMVFSLSLLSSSILIFFLPNEFKSFNIGLKGVRTLLKKSAPAGVSQLIYEGWPSIANTVAKIAKDFSNVGIFSIAEKIANMFSIASISIFTVLLPRNAYKRKREEEFDFKEVFNISILILILAFLGVFLSKFFISGFFGDKFLESLPLMSFLIFASAFTSIHSFMEHYFFIEDRTNYIMYINIGKLVLFLLLSIILIPSLALKGLSLANLITAILAVLATIFFIKKDLKNSSERKSNNSELLENKSSGF